MSECSKSWQYKGKTNDAQSGHHGDDILDTFIPNCCTKEDSISLHVVTIILYLMRLGLSNSVIAVYNLVKISAKIKVACLLSSSFHCE